MSRSNQALAGVACLVTALLASLPVYTLLVLQPNSGASAERVFRFYAGQTGTLKLSAGLWVVSMLAFLVATTVFREAMWGDVFDRPWVTMAAVSGAILFAVLTSVAAAQFWSLASQAAADTAEPQAVLSTWEGAMATMEMGMFALPLPLLGYAMVLMRRCPLGKVCAGIAVAVSVAAVVVGTTALAFWLGWLVLTGIALIAHVDEEHVHDVEIAAMMQ